MTHPDLEEVADLFPASRTLPVYSEAGILSAYDYGDHLGVHYGYSPMPVASIIKALQAGEALGYTEFEHGDEGFFSLVRPESNTEGT